MAFKLRERARKIRENLFKIFCVCSAGIPMAGDDEAPFHKEGRGRLRFVTRRQLDKAMAELQQPQVELTPFEMRLPSEQIRVPHHQQVSSPKLDMPSRPQMGNKVAYEDKLGLTRDLSRALQRRMPHQQASVPCQPWTLDQLTAGDFSIQAICKKHLHEQLFVPSEQVSQRISTPPQQVPAPPQQVSAPPQQISFPPQQISMPHQHVSTLPQQISVPPQQVPAPPQQVSASTPPKHVSLPPQQISVTPKQLPMTPQHVSMPRRFQNGEKRGAASPQHISVPPHQVSVPPHQVSVPPQHISAPPQHVSRPRRFQNLFKFFSPRQQEQEGRDIDASIDVSHQSENGNMKKAVPHQQCYFSHQELFAACQQVPHQQNGEKRGAAPPQQNGERRGAVPPQHIFVPHHQALVPCQQVSVERQAEVISIVKAEIASLLEQVTGRPSSSSIQEIQEMSDFIERALTFRRRDLPVFELSRSPVARPPIFARRAGGAVFTPGATFQPPGAVFTPGTAFQP